MFALAMRSRKHAKKDTVPAVLLLTESCKSDIPTARNSGANRGKFVTQKLSVSQPKGASGLPRVLLLTTKHVTVVCKDNMKFDT